VTTEAEAEGAACWGTELVVEEGEGLFDNHVLEGCCGEKVAAGEEAATCLWRVVVGVALDSQVAWGREVSLFVIQMLEMDSCDMMVHSWSVVRFCENGATKAARRCAQNRSVELMECCDREVKIAL